MKENGFNNPIWFAPSLNGQATPLKLNIGQFEISISGDDSCGVLRNYSRTELCIFDEKYNIVKSWTSVTPNNIISAIRWCNKNQ